MSKKRIQGARNNLKFKHIGARVSELRVLFNLTQREMGEILGVTAPSIHMAEKNSGPLVMEAIVFFHETFQINPSWVIVFDNKNIPKYLDVIKSNKSGENNSSKQNIELHRIAKKLKINTIALLKIIGQTSPKFLILAAMTLISVYGISQPKQVSTAFNWLNLPVDARCAAIAGSETSISGDVNAMTGNPARLLLLPSQHHFSADLLSLPRISSQAKKLSFRYGLKNTDNAAFGVSIDYYTTGNIDLLNEYGAIVGNFKQSEYSLGVGYSKLLSETSSIGVAIRYQRKSNLISILSNGAPGGGNLAADLGYVKHFRLRDDKEKIRLGVSLRSLGGKMQGNYLPTKFSLGVSYTDGHYEADRYSSQIFAFSAGLQIDKYLIPTMPTLDSSGNIIAGIDPANRSVFSNLFSTWADAPKGFSDNLKQLQFSLYSELVWNKAVAFRTGYRYQNPLLGNNQQLSLGAGIIWDYDGSDYRVDLAYIIPVGKAASQSSMVNGLYISFGVNFSKAK